MMGALRGWLLALVSVSILCALAQALMPPGPVRRVGKLACGLVLLCSVLGPLAGVDEQWLMEWDYLNSVEQERILEWPEQERKRIIEEQCSAYIRNKAKKQGFICNAEVFCREEEAGLYLPERARIAGAMSPEEGKWLVKEIESELGLQPGAVVWEGDTGE